MTRAAVLELDRDLETGAGACRLRDPEPERVTEQLLAVNVGMGAVSPTDCERRYVTVTTAGGFLLTMPKLVPLMTMRRGTDPSQLSEVWPDTMATLVMVTSLTFCTLMVK